MEDIKESILFLIENRWRFLVWFLCIFFCSYLVLSLVDFVPEYTGNNTTAALASNYPQSDSKENTMYEQAVHIRIPSVSIDINIEHPESRDITVLDQALQDGVVQYPGTGLLNEETNIFIFGHSSFLPNVINKNYQAFNGLKNVEVGDEVFVDSYTTRYVYRVESLELAEADVVRVNFEEGKRKLTLSTCNSFGAESERYVVEAVYVGSYALTIQNNS